MSIHTTERNHVYAYEPQPEDCFVQTCLGGEDGRMLLSTQPIARYHGAVRWAVGIADQMQSAITLLPITFAEFADANGDQLERWFGNLTAQERDGLRREAITAMLEVMRDCPDRKVRAEALEVLKAMGVAR